MAELCPICNAELREKFDYLDHICMEHHQECSNCKSYYFSYVTGGYQIYIGVKCWQWCYDTPKEEIDKIQADIDTAIDEARRRIAPQANKAVRQ